VLAFAYIRAWKGFLLLRFSARPNISITKDVIGLETGLGRPSVVKTGQGLRAFLEISLPYHEATELKRQTHRALRLLFRFPVVSALYIQENGPPCEHVIDSGAEGMLAKILGFDNQRLAKIPSRGEMRVQCCIAVESIDDAVQLAKESDLMTLIPWESYGHSLGLWDSGAISHGLVESRQVPAVVENEVGYMMPLLITDYEKDYAQTFNHQRIQDLSIHLGRPVVWHCLTFGINKGEVRRIKRVALLESAYPKAFLDKETRLSFEETPKQVERLETELASGRKPRLLKQCVWVQLSKDDEPRVVQAMAKEWLFERGITAKGLTPTRALAAFASMFPGLERHSADTQQGLGIAGGEDELLCEMEALSNWPGHKDAHLMLTDEAGKSMRFSLFEGGNNFNMVIVGEPGSGKSVVINGLATTHLARSRYNKAILVDYGGSFSGIVEAAGGMQISHKDRGRFTISPLPIFGPLLTEDVFSSEYPGESYGDYVQEQTSLRGEVLKQSLIFIKGYLCTKQVEDNGVFRELFFQLVGLYALPGVGLVRIIEQIREHVTKALTEEHTDIRRQALADLVSMFEEMASVCAISPFIGDNGLDLRGHRLISFNLDGFGEDDKNVLVGLINLLIHQVFGERVAGKTLIVFDEVHKFIKTGSGSLGKILDSTSRVTRKYGASLVLASQSPSDYDCMPYLIENANHHVIMRLKTRELPPEWKITDRKLLDHARTGTPPADAVGYSTLHLGTTTGDGDLQGVFCFSFTPLALYPFTSKQRDKSLMELACYLTGLENTIDLAELTHQNQDDAVQLVPIGSPEFWEAVEGRLLARYKALRGKLPGLFRDLEVCPFLDLFLKGGKENFERVVGHENHLNAFIQQHYEVSP